MSRKVEKKETKSEVVLHSLFANNDDVSCSALCTLFLPGGTKESRRKSQNTTMRN